MKGDKVVEALKYSVKLIHDDYCSHPGDCSPELDECSAGQVVSAIGIAEQKEKCIEVMREFLDRGFAHGQMETELAALDKLAAATIPTSDTSP